MRLNKLSFEVINYPVQLMLHIKPENMNPCNNRNALGEGRFNLITKPTLVILIFID